MNASPDKAEVARLVALAEEGLRRQGFTETRIRRRRKTTRGVIERLLAERASQ